MRNSNPAFLKLLQRVCENPQMGFDFSGLILRPGKRIAESVLRPPGFPDLPVLLECAGTAQGRGYARGECLYILWQYADCGWIEIGRARSCAWEWSVDLGPMARRAIEQSTRSLALIEILPNLIQVESRIRKAIAREMLQLDAGDRVRLAAALHDHLAAEFARAA